MSLMKKILLSLLATLALWSAPATAGCWCFEPEVRISYFVFSDTLLDDIYGTGAPNYQFGIAYPFCNCLSGWASVGYIHKCGRSIGEGDRTRMTLVPVNFGLRYFLPSFCCAGKFYFEGGGSYYHCSFHNDNDFVLRHVYRNGVGGFIGAGTQWPLFRNLFVDLFIDYSVRRTHCLEHKEGTIPNNVSLGGWDFGGGVGYRF